MYRSHEPSVEVVAVGDRSEPTIPKRLLATASAHLATARRVARHRVIAAIAVDVILASAPLMAQDATTNVARAAQPETASSQQGKPSEAMELSSLLQDLNLQEFWSQNTLKHWLILLASIFLGLLIGKIVSIILRRVGERFDQSGWIARGQFLSGLAAPASLGLFTIGLMFGLAGLKMSSILHSFGASTLLLLFVISVFWYAFNLVAIVDVVLRRRAAKTESDLDRQMAPLIRKSLRVFLVVLALMFIVDSVFQQDIGAWLAGLGIAGLAISLAAQDSLKNLFGSITILLDQPFRIGERIVYGGHDGNIEEIGFRSVKVRTLDGHLVTIPNSNIVNDTVQNIGRRPFIKRAMNVTITYDTPRERIEHAVKIIQGILEEEGICEPIHAEINGDTFPPRVHFNDYNSDSLNILVLYWFTPPAYWDYLAHAQKVNLRIFEEFEKEGIEFAFPTQTLYLAGDTKRQMAVQMLAADLGQTG